MVHTSKTMDYDSKSQLRRERRSEVRDWNPPSFSIIRLRPNSILPWRQDPLWIERVLDLHIKFHLRVVVEVVSFRNLVHECKMRSILAPSVFGTVIDEGSD